MSIKIMSFGDENIQIIKEMEIVSFSNCVFEQNTYIMKSRDFDIYRTIFRIIDIFHIMVKFYTILLGGFLLGSINSEMFFINGQPKDCVTSDQGNNSNGCIIKNNSVIEFDNGLGVSTNKVIGCQNTIGGYCNNLEGNGNGVLGSDDNIIGSQNFLNGNYNDVIGNLNQLIGSMSSVVGSGNKAIGNYNCV